VDSVESLLRQSAAALLGGAASDRVLRSARLSKSPAALRSYLEGLALFRRGFIAAAATAFERSVATDSLFASAAYQRWLMAQAYAGGGVIVGNWAPRTRQRIDLLTDRERTVFEADAGKGVPRTRMQVYNDRRSAAEKLGDSPEAWYFVGDYVYHDGNAVVGVDSVIPLARQFFSLAVGLDTQPVFLYHLTELAINTNDSALMRRLLPAYSRVEGEERWIRQWSLAAALGDQRVVDSLRRVVPPDWGRQTELALGSLISSRVRAASFSAVVQQLATPHPLSDDMRGIMSLMEFSRGRPGPILPRSVSGVFTPISGDFHTDSATVVALQSIPPIDSVDRAYRQCLRVRLIVERRGAAPLDSIPLPRCRNAVRAMDEFNKGTLTDSALARFDTLVTYGRFSTFLGFEHRALARIYEARGDTARALRALQMRPRDYMGTWIAPTLREEGRLFLMTGDTARAVESYEEYLARRIDAQPPFVAERDSVRALVTRLKQRVVP